MMAKREPKVVILDDEKSVESAIRSRLPKQIAKNAVSVEPDDIAKLVTKLGQRISAARKSNRKKPEDIVVDGADLLIVDYDLVEARGEDYLTGETIAYLARCYSRCGVIVALNQFHRHPTFDLTLRPQLDSFADLNISADDLKNSGLWNDGPWKGYRPWNWPVLPNLINLMQQRVRDVEKAALKLTVMEFLGFPQSVIERLPTTSLELLGGSRAAELATLQDILSSTTLGLRGKEATQRKPSPSQDARIIAARLSCWLNMVLAPQDVLVDAPHLAARCPSLAGPTATPTTLSRSIRLNPELDIFKNPSLREVRLEKNFWFDRPVWFWTEIEKRRILPEVKDPWKTVRLEYAFCEDISSFKKRSAVKNFQSDLLSPYRIRQVSELPDIEYQPQHRLALS